MPHVRHRWATEQAAEACPRRIHRFLETCLLLLLHCDEVHGYELCDSLCLFGFEQNPVDSSTVYRVLRNLEDASLVTSRWDTENPGPARRLYRLTEEGDRYLARWVEDLRQTAQVIHSFLDTYDSHMAGHRARLAGPSPGPGSEQIER